MAETHVGRAEAARVALVVGLCALLAYALADRGGFFSPASTVVLAASLCLLGASYLVEAEPRPVRAEDLALLGLALWWFVAAELHGAQAHFEPMGASIVGFVAASVVVRRAPVRWRRGAGHFVVAVASVCAVVGLVGGALRWTPYALRAQDLWRLAGTLTYSNAAGLLLAMALVLATDRSLRTRWTPVAVAACAAGLVASQSRSAVLAAVVAFLWLARAGLVATAVPIASGVLAGLVAVATSRGPTGRPWALALTLVIVALAGLADTAVRRLLERRAARGRSRRVTVVLAAVGAVALAGALAAARTEAAARVDTASNVGRLHAWRAALDQFGSSWVSGVGPDRPLVLSTSGPVTTYFAHNEYLQLLAGAGIVAMVLLAAAVLSVLRRLRAGRGGLGTARAVLLAFVLAGFFDFTWHVPALAIVAGVALGLAVPDAEMADRPDRVPLDTAAPGAAV